MTQGCPEMMTVINIPQQCPFIFYMLAEKTTVFLAVTVLPWFNANTELQNGKLPLS